MVTEIILSDDHRIIREGLGMLLEYAGYKITAECENGRKAVEKCRELNPDLIIMDISMAELNGVEAARQIKSEGLKTKIIALSMHTESRYVIQMLKAGASGYMIKDCEFGELDTAIKAVINGQIYLDPRIAGSVILKCISEDESNANMDTVITPREQEIVQLLTEGKKTKEVAERLFISPKTVETHRRKIMAKLELKSLAELTKYAIREGLTTVED